MAVNELADKAIKETMEFYTKYRVEYDFKKVCSAERETKPKLDQAKPYMHMMALSDSSWYLVINLSHTHAHTQTLSLSS